MLAGVRLESDVAHNGHIERRRHIAFKQGGGENRAASVGRAIRQQIGHDPFLAEQAIDRAGGNRGFKFAVRIAP